MGCAQQNVSAKTNRSPDYKKVIDSIFTCTNEHLMILMNQMVNAADDRLFDQAEKAKNDEERMKYMDCTRIFRTEKNDINRQFFINLNKSLSISEPEFAQEEEEQELSLVAQDEMEEMVAITTMHAKAMSLYGQEVNHMEARLEYLEIMCADIFDKEALDPKHICEIFQRSIEDLDMAIEVKLIFYKLFDEEVCSRLGVMYKTINQIFIDNDIMPEILLKSTRQEDVIHEEEEVATQVATYYDPTVNVATDFIPRTKEEISKVVNEFMSGDMTITGDEIELPESFLRTPTKQDLNGENCYERKEVIKALSKLQRKITSMQDAAEVLSSERIKQELLSDISKDNGGVVDKHVNLLDERSIDFVGMMFDAIVEDETVSEIMTGLIGQLQVPVIKVAMSDNSLFEEDEHPARMTVDLLTQAGKGVTQQEDRLFSELESIVDNILDEFDIDVESFEKAVDELEDLIHKEEQLTQENERQQQRKIVQEHAKKIVITQLKMVSCDKKIPGSVRPLVLKHWSTLMLNRYIRHGRSSEQWVESVLLLKLLLKCMQPIRFKSQYNMVRNNHDALLEAVNDELYQTQQDQDDIAEQIFQLREHFLKMIDECDLEITDDENNVVDSESLLSEQTETTEEELQRIQKQADIAKQKIAQLTSQTKPGVWYEIYNGEDRAVRRLKLSVILTDAAQLIFVDRKGLKVIEKDAEEFARELEDNRSRVLADHSTFDHALGKVISALAA